MSSLAKFQRIMLHIQDMGAFSNQFNRVIWLESKPCPPATLSHTNPLNISEI